MYSFKTNTIPTNIICWIRRQYKALLKRKAPLTLLAESASCLDFIHRVYLYHHFCQRQTFTFHQLPAPPPHSNPSCHLTLPPPSHSSCWGLITTTWPSSTVLSSSSTACTGCLSCASEDPLGWEPPTIATSQKKRGKKKTLVFVRLCHNSCSLPVRWPASALRNCFCERFVASFPFDNAAVPLISRRRLEERPRTQTHACGPE